MRGHRTCLGDIMQNIAKMNLLIFRGEPGASFTKGDLNRTNFNFSN